jgi:hypothetical protein
LENNNNDDDDDDDDDDDNNVSIICVCVYDSLNRAGALFGANEFLLFQCAGVQNKYCTRGGGFDAMIPRATGVDAEHRNTGGGGAMR